jgi:tetratricopeptide (TPR) repeat protein
LAVAPQQAAASTAPATSSANTGVGNEASTGAPALPARLRRWLKPTPVQQRVIDAFWARADKNFVRAERLLSEAHALDPKDAEVAYQLALTYARQGRLEQTLSWARQARELSPLDPAPIALEGDIHALHGQGLDAERVWKQCLQVRPGDPGCVRRLEQLKSRSGS